MFGFGKVCLGLDVFQVAILLLPWLMTVQRNVQVHVHSVIYESLLAHDELLKVYNGVSFEG